MIAATLLLLLATFLMVAKPIHRVSAGDDIRDHVARLIETLLAMAASGLALLLLCS